MYFIFFSKEQKSYNREIGFRDTFARLEDGRIVEYTEMCRKERPSGNWDDYALLGKGDFDHVVGIPSNGTVKINLEIFRGSENKFDSFKLSSKFKPKSPKNIFKKRPYGY